MNLDTTLESIEICRRALSSEAYQDYEDALKMKDPNAAIAASALSGDIDRALNDLKFIVEEYQNSMLND